MVGHWDIIVVIGYFFVLIGMGVAFTKLNQDTTDYFIGGRKATWWMVGMSGFVMGISAYTFTGNAGAAYKAGWAVLPITVASATSFLIAAVYFAPRLRRTRAVTMQEVIRDRYTLGTETMYSTIGPLRWILGSAVGLWAISSFVAAVFAWQLDLLIVGIGMVVLIYSLTGGRWAVMATDFVQGVVMVLMSLAITIYALVRIGGMSGIRDQALQQGLADTLALFKPSAEFGFFDDFSVGWIIVSFIMLMVLQCSLMTGVRFLANKSEMDARKSSVLILVGYLFGGLLWIVPPIAARLMYSEDVMAMQNLSDPSEAAYAVMALKVLPNGMVGMLVIAIFAAAMSTLDSGMNNNAAIFVRNLLPKYQRWRGRPLPSDAVQFRIARTLTVVFGVAIIGLALFLAHSGIKSIFDLGMNIMGVIVLPMALPMMGAVFFRRLHPWTAYITVVCGALPSVLQFAGLFQWGFTARTLAVFSAAAVGLIAGRLLWSRTSPADQKRINEVYRRMETPIDVEKEVGPLVDFVQLKMVGVGLLFAGGFVVATLLLPNTLIDRGVILLIGLAILALGGCMVYASYIYTPEELKASGNNSEQSEPQAALASANNTSESEFDNV